MRESANGEIRNQKTFELKERIKFPIGMGGEQMIPEKMTEN
jgi:hypothetical protein